jgi:hypothetical protein
VLVKGVPLMSVYMQNKNLDCFKGTFFSCNSFLGFGGLGMVGKVCTVALRLAVWTWFL